ncbi:MAG: AraC family transcriptional regulator [Clostridiales bacterium]|nr:AraC family transcriptional regulator [Clostridiales bacterium]
MDGSSERQDKIPKYTCCLAAMQCYLSLIFTELLRDQIYTAEKENLQDTNLTEILTYISNHLNDISLNSLAEHFHYDSAYLSKLLKKYFGRTFSNLVSEMRVSRVATYLLNNDISIDAIVEQLGYYDRSYFNRVFRKRYGCSPQEYRQNKGKNEAAF